MMNNNSQMPPMPPIPSPKKKWSFQQIAIATCIALLGIVFIIIIMSEVRIEICHDKLIKTQSDSVYEIMHNITLAREDSIAKVKEAENKATVKRLQNKFRTEKDEFEERSWIYHKKTAKYTDENSVHLYFQQSKNGKTSNLRFRVQYAADDWLFIKKMIFNIDGENFTFYPDDMDRDCGYGGKIWEWCDEQASANKDLVYKISNAKCVKIKMEGKQYYGKREMSQSQLNAFKETLEYYTALGGEL